MSLIDLLSKVRYFWHFRYWNQCSP